MAVDFLLLVFQGKTGAKRIYQEIPSKIHQAIRSEEFISHLSRSRLLSSFHLLKSSGRGEPTRQKHSGVIFPGLTGV